MIPVMGGMVEYQMARRLELARWAAGATTATPPATGASALLGREARTLAEVWRVPPSTIDDRR